MKRLLLTILLLSLLLVACNSEPTNLENNKEDTNNIEVTEDNIKETKHDVNKTDDVNETSTEANESQEDLMDAAFQESLIMLGKASQGIYSNEFFNFSMKYPPTWYVLSETQLFSSMIEGANRMGYELTDFNVSEIPLIMIFGGSEADPSDTSMTFISNIGISGEKLFDESLELNATDYADVIEEQFLGYSYILSDRDTVLFDNHEFETLEFKVEREEFNIYQRFYIIKIEDYMMNFTLSYKDDSKEALIGFMDTIKFTK